MRPPHLLRVDLPPADLAPFFTALHQEGLRAGWLDLDSPTATSPRPPALDAAASLGALRAVAVDADRTVVVKPRRGPAVLGDLLREHFRGAHVVLVRGDILAPLLRPDGDGWQLVEPGGAVKQLSTPALLAALRRPADPVP